MEAETAFASFASFSRFLAPFDVELTTGSLDPPDFNGQQWFFFVFFTVEGFFMIPKTFLPGCGTDTFVYFRPVVRQVARYLRRVLNIFFVATIVQWAFSVSSLYLNHCIVLYLTVFLYLEFSSPNGISEYEKSCDSLSIHYIHYIAGEAREIYIQF